MNPKEAIEIAVKIAGGQAELARLLETPDRRCYQQMVFNWIKNGQVPADWACDISAISGIAPAVFRPDVFKVRKRA